MVTGEESPVVEALFFSQLPTCNYNEDRKIANLQMILYFEDRLKRVFTA